MVQSEYGWSDKKVLNLTLRRFRQVLAAINTRKYFEYRREIDALAWHLRVSSSYIAGGYMVSGDTNPAFDMAQKIAYDEIQIAQLEEAQNAPQEVKAQEAPAGSFERIMGSLGSPKNWAGR